MVKRQSYLYFHTVDKVLFRFHLALAIIFMLIGVCSAHAQNLPKPGQVIDHNNYKEYKELFSDIFALGFENGFEMTPTITVKVSETGSYPFPEPVKKASMKNKGKYDVDSEGFITGGYDYIGFPFPNLDPADKKYAQKVMWNFTYRYLGDTKYGKNTSSMWLMRKGQPIRYQQMDYFILRFASRYYIEPKNVYENPAGLLWAKIQAFTYPSSVRGTSMLNYRYMDPRKQDDTYIYLPSLRRVVRLEAGERSTPAMGTVVSPDDFNGFEGRNQDFTFKYLGTKKMMGVQNCPWETKDDLPARTTKEFPLCRENWEVREVFVIEALPKDPDYPVARRRLYIDKETYCILFSDSYDRSGNPWKLFVNYYKREKLPSGDIMSKYHGGFGIDIQTSFLTAYAFTNMTTNTHDLKYSEFLPSALRTSGR
ncbi:DUF1329 domain-containing protein [Desulfocicer niacini]